MSIFDDINQRADAIKAAKRAAYKASKSLPRSTWMDRPNMVTIPTFGDSGTRSTYTIIDTNGDGTRSTHSVIARPTEALALLHAAGLWFYDDEIMVMTLPMVYRKDKWCDGCQQRKPQSAFGRDKRTSDGLAFYCRACREKIADSRWTRGKAFKFNRVLNSLTPQKAVIG